MDMNETIITWNMANWITVVLMALVGFMLFGLATSYAKKRVTSAVAAKQGQ